MKINQITEGLNPIGARIKAAYQKIYNAGDDAVEFAYYDSPIFAQYWDEYEGDLDSIIAEVDPSELQIILDELEAAAEDQGVAEGSLNEFAPAGSGDGGDDGFSEETLKQLAAQWYNGDEDPRVERTLMAAGWEIGQDEGYDNEPGVFVVQAGDVNGNSYMSWPAHELQQGVAETYYDRGDYYNAKQGGEYGRDLPQTDNRRNSGISDKHERGGRDDIFKGKSKNLPADPFARTTGVAPKPGSGRIYTTALPDEVDEGKPKEKEADYGSDYQDMVSRVKKLAGLGPLKTVYDPQKRVYKNVPTAVQPKK